MVNGQRVTAPMYCSPCVAPDQSAVQLNFIFLFGLSGPQCIWFARDSNTYVLPDMGVYEGDIEFVTVAVDPGFKFINWMRTEGHGEMR